MIDNRIIAVYNRYKNWASVHEKETALWILKKICSKLWVTIEELEAMIEKDEFIEIEYQIERKFSLAMANVVAKFYHEKYDKTLEEIWLYSKRVSRNFKTFIIKVKSWDENKLKEFLNFYHNKISKDYKVFLSKKPNIEDFLEWFVSKNDLYWKPKDWEVSFWDVDLDKIMRIKSMMRDMDDSDFISSSNMIEWKK